MFRKVLALLLVGSWVIFSGIDLLEDLSPTNSTQVRTTQHLDFRDFGPKVANNTLENGTRILIGQVGLVSPPARVHSTFQPRDQETKRPKNLKIYKLHNAFLI